MRIFFSGIGGVGIGPLAEIALDAGYEVVGSDLKTSPLTEALIERGASVAISQDGSFLRDSHAEKPIDWFVYTSALAPDHPELVFAQANGIRATKRDELIAQIIRDRRLTLIAVSGTHGKTTTTGMLIWTLQKLGIPISYSIGTTMTFGPSGVYKPGSKYFIYECDEFDRNMLHFYPEISLIPALDHDHFDTYPTPEDYKKAFVTFIEQSGFSLMWEKDLRYLMSDLQADYEAYDELMDLSYITLVGEHNRRNAYLVQRAITGLLPGAPEQHIVQYLNTFPGTDRRMEKLAENLYSDYGHHPSEVTATLQLARELSDQVVLVYQPHQNVRQHEIQSLYRDSMKQAMTIYWLPTYLSREHEGQSVLSAEQLASGLTNESSVIFSKLDEQLWAQIEKERASGKLVLVMGAGSIDAWVREHLAE